MRTARVLVAVCMLSGLCGCADKAEQLSSSSHLLARQHEVWRRARESLASPSPNLMYLRSVHIFLRGRTRRAVEKDYARPNKEQVLAKLDALKAAYEAEIMSKVAPGSFEVRLRSGVALADVRAAFEKLDGPYRELEAMTAGE